MSNYAHPEVLVDCKWLSKHLEDPLVRIVEVDLNSQLYDRDRIPNSVFLEGMLPFKSDFRVNFDPQAFATLLGNLGITNDMTVVFAHNSYIGTSGFSFWLLKVFGHDDVRILNGGRKKWQLDGYPVTTDKTVIEKTEYHAPPADENLRISLAQLQELNEKNNCFLLDARTSQEYSGEIFMMKPPTENERAGHIPGAINIFYERAHNEDDTFKSFSELEMIYDRLKDSMSMQKLIIPYCAIGARSGHTWFIIKYLLGYPHVKNYDASWNQWSRIPELPIEN